MKTLFTTIILFATTVTAYASPSFTFEEVLRNAEPLGKTVLSSIETGLIAKGYQKGANPLSVNWDNQSYTAELWYVKPSPWSSIQILIKGSLKDSLAVDSIEVSEQRP